MSHPNAHNFNRMTLVSFQAAPVGYEFVFYCHSYRKVWPGRWATVHRDKPGTTSPNPDGGYIVGDTYTDQQMADLAAEYRERGM
jgi:hypothetical protein